MRIDNETAKYLFINKIFPTYILDELLSIINIKCDENTSLEFYAGMLNEYYRRVAYRLTTHLRPRSTLFKKIPYNVHQAIVCQYVMFLHGHQGSGKTTLALATSSAINKLLCIDPGNTLGQFYEKVTPLYMKPSIPESLSGDMSASFHYSPTVVVDDVRSLSQASQMTLCFALTTRDYALRYPHMKGPEQ